MATQDFIAPSLLFFIVKCSACAVCMPDCCSLLAPRCHKKAVCCSLLAPLVYLYCYLVEVVIRLRLPFVAPLLPLQGTQTWLQSYFNSKLTSAVRRWT